MSSVEITGDVLSSRWKGSYRFLRDPSVGRTRSGRAAKDRIAVKQEGTAPLAEAGGGHASELRACLERVLSGSGRAIHRLASAGTSVTFRIAGAESVTIFLDRRPVAVAEGTEPAEIVIELTPEQADQFVRGALSLPTAILEGEIRCRGPVRKYLAVDPIIRALLSEEDGRCRAG